MNTPSIPFILVHHPSFLSLTKGGFVIRAVTNTSKLSGALSSLGNLGCVTNMSGNFKASLNQF